MGSRPTSLGTSCASCRFFAISDGIRHEVGVVTPYRVTTHQFGNPLLQPIDGFEDLNEVIEEGRGHDPIWGRDPLVWEPQFEIGFLISEDVIAVSGVATHQFGNPVCQPLDGFEDVHEVIEEGWGHDPTRGGDPPV